MEALYERIASTIGPILCVSSNQTNNLRLGAAPMLTPVEGPSQMAPLPPYPFAGVRVTKRRGGGGLGALLFHLKGEKQMRKLCDWL